MIACLKTSGGVTQYKGNKMETFAKALGYILLGIIVIVVLGLLFSLPVMFLWNLCLVPAIPGINTIGWLQAWGIMILSGFLFKNYTHNKE